MGNNILFGNYPDKERPPKTLNFSAFTPSRPQKKRPPDNLIIRNKTIASFFILKLQRDTNSE